MAVAAVDSTAVVAVVSMVVAAVMVVADTARSIERGRWGR
jgi:hypothetical protein